MDGSHERGAMEWGMGDATNAVLARQRHTPPYVSDATYLRRAWLHDIDRASLQKHSHLREIGEVLACGYRRLHGSTQAGMRCVII